MTLISVEKKTDSCGRVLLLSCDQCSIHFKKSYLIHTLKKSTHFCSKQCTNLSKKKGGIIHQKYTETCNQKYGCDNSFQSPIIKEKCIQTLRKNYGGEVINPSQVESIRQKIKETCVSHLGVDNPLKSVRIREKGKETMIERYGVSCPSYSQEIKEKIRQSTLTNTGYEYSFQNPDVRKKAQENMLKKHGVLHGWQSSIIREKILDSQIKNCSIQTSKIENKFFQDLQSCYGIDNIIRFVKVHKWPIDFYIKTLDVYVQFDGDYWHGLDRDMSIIESSNSARDKTILSKVRNDRKQESWFLSNGLKLLRIKESDYRSTNILIDVFSISYMRLNV